MRYNLLEPVGIKKIREIESRFDEVFQALRMVAFSPNQVKTLDIRFKLSDIAKMLDVSSQTIRNAEKKLQNELPADPSTGKRSYTLGDVNRLRTFLNKLPHRAENEETVIFPIQNFKGGVGKSTTVCHAAQWFAMQGYRVAVFDCDPQATTTMLFGHNPDVDIAEEDTIIPYLEHGGPQDLNYALKDTNWPGIKLVPSNMSLANIEYLFAAKVGQDPNILNKLRFGIDTIKDQFDIILLDPPPALGFISLSVLRAANALVIPVPPSTIDFSSSRHFFSMLRENIEVLEQHGFDTTFKFLKILTTRFVDTKLVQKEIKAQMLEEFGNTVFVSSIKDSAAIDNAASNLKTVYELVPEDLNKRDLGNGEFLPALVSRDAYNRCIAYLNATFSEIELLVRKTWPSQHEALRKEGLI